MMNILPISNHLYLIDDGTIYGSIGVGHLNRAGDVARLRGFDHPLPG